MIGERRIAQVRATPVNIPLHAPYRWSRGIFPGFSKTVVEVETDDGTIGLGEAPNAASAEIIGMKLGPALVGADPFDLASCEARCLPETRTLQNTDDSSIVRAYGGVEIALWDLMGKSQGRSVADLLGGAVRTLVPFTEYFAFRLPAGAHGGEASPVDVARYCFRMREQHGSTVFEGKLGVEPLSVELRMADEVRQAIGDDALLRFDANMAWSSTTARHALARLEAYDVSSIEEPVRTFQELARLRETTAIGFSSHALDLRSAAALGAPDAFVLNLTALGGIRRSLKFIAACEELGFDAWFYSPDTGIATAAYLQVAAATAWIHLPSQSLLRWHADDVIDGGPMVIADGHLAVPNGPGLGVTLDRVALKRCHDRYLQDGAYDAYSDPARSGRYHAWT